MISWLIFLCLALPTVVFLVETLAGLLPWRPMERRDCTGTLALIVPAHDETAGIVPMLTALREAMPSAARVIVVADNCTDDSAALARVAGAEVIERNEPERRGKGYALAFARDHLAANPPDVAIVIDADCTAEPGALAALASMARESGRPVQGCYLMRPSPDRGMMVAISSFAFLLKNRLRQRGLARLGQPAILTGSGMAFPWQVFAAAPLATGDTVEDLVLGIALAKRGCAPLYLDDARFWTLPAGRAATAQQRGRWERGFLAAAVKQAPRLIGSGAPGALWLGLHLLVPPVAALVSLHLLGAVAIALLDSGPVLAAELALLILSALVLIAAWAMHGRAYLRWTTLLAFPFYIVWKIPIYAAALLRRPRRWNRTER